MLTEGSIESYPTLVPNLPSEPSEALTLALRGNASATGGMVGMKAKGGLPSGVR